MSKTQWIKPSGTQNANWPGWRETKNDGYHRVKRTMMVKQAKSGKLYLVTNQSIVQGKWFETADEDKRQGDQYWPYEYLEMLEFFWSLALLQKAQHPQGNQGNQHFKTGNQRLVHEVLCAIKSPGPSEPLSRCKSMSNNLTLKTAGGRIICTQCQAKSKRTKQQCRAPASKGKIRCRFHGGKSTGPKTTEGRQRIAAIKTIHGFESRKTRTDRVLGMRRLRALEELGHLLGVLYGPRTPGRKPT